jgi:putative hydrolase
MPGWSNNPFGFDLQEFLRMMQSSGPVNMEVARKVAEATAAIDPESEEDGTGQKPEAQISPEVAHALDDVVRAVQLMVAESTSISGALSIPAQGVTRRDWAYATLAGLEPVFSSLASALGQVAPPPPGDPMTAAQSPEMFFGALMQQLVPMLLGTSAGSMVGALSHHALGQYDLPLPLAGEPKLLFVVGNIDDFAEEWALPIDELHTSLALREIVHGAQRSVPWVRERLVRLASTYVGAYEVQPSAFEEKFGNLDPNVLMSGENPFDDPQALLGAMHSERQTPLLEELQRYVSVLEGYTDLVVATLGERMVASHARIDEALRRHRLERGEAGELVDQLLGLRLDREHYEAGIAFCRGVVERSDNTLDQLNRLWTDESKVPTRSELEAPGLWLARIDLPDA